MKSRNMSNSNYTGHKHFFMAKYLYELLCENNNNIEDPMFASIWECLKNQEDLISIAQHIDFLLYPDVESVIEEFDSLNLSTVWRSDFDDFEVGEYIDGKLVVSKCLFTIWLLEE
jgi:hypothetical protein